MWWFFDSKPIWGLCRVVLGARGGRVSGGRSVSRALRFFDSKSICGDCARLCLARGVEGISGERSVSGAGGFSIRSQSWGLCRIVLGARWWKGFWVGGRFRGLAVFRFEANFGDCAGLCLARGGGRGLGWGVGFGGWRFFDSKPILGIVQDCAWREVVEGVLGGGSVSGAGGFSIRSQFWGLCRVVLGARWWKGSRV